MIFGLHPGQGSVMGTPNGPPQRRLELTNKPMKTKDTRKETKKQPTKTAKEKKLAKQEKKNSR